MADIETVLEAMLDRMVERFSQGMPVDRGWRDVSYREHGRPQRLDPSKQGSPHAFVTEISSLWESAGLFRELQEVWMADPKACELDYVKSYDLWKSANCLPERIARLSLIRLLSNDPEPIRREDLRAFADDLRSTTQYFVTVAPLSGVSLEAEPIVFSPEMRIRRLSPIEHGFLVNSKMFAGEATLARQWWRYTTVVEVRLPVNYHRELNTRIDEAAEMVERARLVLSVAAGRDVYSPGPVGSLETAFPVAINYAQLRRASDDRAHPWPHPLTEVERNWAAQLAPSLVTGELSVAASRLGFAQDRDSPMDALIDAWVTLEALFGKGLGNELSYRIAVRIANYLGDSPIGRQDLFSFLRASYNMRSRLVHGDKKQPSPQEVAETAQRTVSLARSCLRMSLLNTDEFKPETLDAAPFLPDA